MLATTSNRNDYIGTGATGPFPYTFKVFAATDLLVERTPIGGTPLTLTYLTDYTVSVVGAGSGGSITLISALANGDKLTIRRVRPLTQSTSFRDLGEFLPETHEDALDHVVMLAQQHNEQLGRALTHAPSVVPGTVSPTLPVPEANKALFWNAAMSALESRALDTSGVIAIPGEGRVTPTATGYLANNAEYNPRDYSLAAITDGATDATAAINAANSWALAASGRIAFKTPGAYRVNTGANYTHAHFAYGAIVKPADTQTCTFVGHLEGRPTFDESLGGRVLVTGPTSVLDVSWWQEVTTALWTAPVPKTPFATPGPTKDNPGALYGMGSIVANHNYRVATTRHSMDAVGVARETGPGDFTGVIQGVNEGMFGILPEDPGCGLENGETGIATAFGTYVADMAEGPTTTVGAVAPGAGDASINVVTTGAFPSSGFVQINNEFVYYTSTDGTHLLGCTRGVLGSAAAAHITGATVTGINPHRSEYNPNGTSDGYTRGLLQIWGDILDHLNATFCAFDNSKPGPPAPGTTGIDGNGATVKAPPVGASAPTIIRLGTLQRNGAYDFKVCWEYGDGSVGPLSALATGTIGNYAGGHMLVYPGAQAPWTGLEVPPLGAHFLRIYAAKTGGTLRLVKRVPAGPMSIEIHDIPDASDTPSRAPTAPVYPGQGACISTISPIILAARCARDSGGARGIRVAAGINYCKSPLPLDANPNFVNALGEGGFGSGLRIFADGGLNGVTEVRFQAADWVDGRRYEIGALARNSGNTYVCILGHVANGGGGLNTGNGTYWQLWTSVYWNLDTVNTITTAGAPTPIANPLLYPGRPGIINTYPRLIIENVRFTDPAAIVRYGLRMSDYSGGGSQYCRLINSAIDAEAPRSIGAIADCSSGGPNSHTCSEFFVLGGFLGGRRGCAHFTGTQTGNIHFDQLVQFSCGSDAGGGRSGATSAISYCIKHACPNGVLTVETPFLNGGQARLVLTDTWLRDGGGASVFYARSFGGECHNANGGAFGIITSPMDANGAKIRLMGECGFQNSTGHAFYDIYTFSRAHITSLNNLWANPIVLDHVFAEFHHAGGNLTKLLRTTRFYGGGQAPAQAYPQVFNYSTSFQTDVLIITPLLGGAADVLTAPNNSYIEVDCTAAARTVRIPSAKYRPGQLIIIKKTDTSANGVTINSLGDQSNNGKTFDGAASAAIPGGSAGALQLISNGTEWKAVGKI